MIAVALLGIAVVLLWPAAPRPPDAAAQRERADFERAFDDAARPPPGRDGGAGFRHDAGP